MHFAYESYLYGLCEPDQVQSPNYARIANVLSNQKHKQMTQQLINLHTQALAKMQERQYLLDTVNTLERKHKLETNRNEYLQIIKQVIETSGVKLEDVVNTPY